MENISVEISDHIATVVIDRAPVNAVTMDMLAQLRQIFGGFANNDDVRAVILTASGERAFIAGVDLKEIGGPEANTGASAFTRDRVVREALWAVYDCVVPVIAAVNGPAIGAGLAFVSVCDMIVAANSATFSMAEMNVGLLGGGAFLRLLVPRQKLREMFLTCDAVTAHDLYRIGSVRAVVERSELQRTAQDLAASIAAKSPIATRLAKESLNRTEFMPLKEAYRTEQDYTHRLLEFEDSEEARSAFLERRPANWKMR
jgi:enoyl-CoA hydratase